MEKRLKYLETTMQAYGRRHDDCEKERLEMHRIITELVDWREAIKESTQVNKEMVEVAQSILLALNWAGIAAKWIIYVGGAMGILWAGFKTVLTMGVR